jgi:hypothetical protein
VLAPAAHVVAHRQRLLSDALGLLLELADQVLDLLGGAARALGELADLLGDDRKPLRVAGARGLDRAGSRCVFSTRWRSSR